MKRMKTGGRKAGTPNRVTASIKGALLEAFDRMGGVDALTRWGEEHPSEFYSLVGRLVPREPMPAAPVERVQLLSREEREQRMLELLRRAQARLSAVGGQASPLLLPSTVRNDTSGAAISDPSDGCRSMITHRQPESKTKDHELHHPHRQDC